MCATFPRPALECSCQPRSAFVSECDGGVMTYFFLVPTLPGYRRD